MSFHTRHSTGFSYFFFIDVYLSKVHPSQTDLDGFLDVYPMPGFLAPDAKTLNAPLTEDEILMALEQTQHWRAPGADGLPAEV